MTSITADFSELDRQAPDAVANYMLKAKREIDELFGAGYAAQNPALVAAFMQAAERHFSASSTVKVLGESLEAVATALNDVADALSGERNPLP